MGYDNILVLLLIVCYGLGEWLHHIYHQDDEL